MSISPVPGSDALSATLTPRTYAGSDVLSVPVNTSAPAAALAAPSGAPATTKNPYQTAYEQITTASAASLMKSLAAGTTNALSYVSEGDSQPNVLSGISSMMDALKAGMAEGMFGGSGFDILV
ncbi:MAG: hypothetical protein M3R30_07010 [Candidatus Eremiobacteraeota bacterium]|nr:hypothetical protein [Candidatus Eremiobacteraeota bacterium]